MDYYRSVLNGNRRSDRIAMALHFKLVDEIINSTINDRFTSRFNRLADLAPVMTGVFYDHHLNRRPDRFGLLFHVVSMFDRDRCVFVALNH